ncbi:MAG: transposase [Planctomycetales bacterium]|nr:transposase [Planctomycetales bacterium]
MRSGSEFMLSAAGVKTVAMSWIQEHLQFEDYKRKCSAGMILSVLLFAAVRVRSISDACARLTRAPSDETFRKALAASLPEQHQLESRLNKALSDRLPKNFFKSKRGKRVAIDLTLIPDHGEPAREEREIRRSQPKQGTTHFHAYATAYIVHSGERFTIAMTAVLGDESVKDVLQRLLWEIRRIGIKVRVLLVDKEFFNVDVVRYLQAAKCPFVVPAFARGRKPKVLRAGSLHAYAASKRSGWGAYSWKNKDGKRASVKIAIVCRNYRGQRERHGRRTQLYAYWGVSPGTVRWVWKTYRLRFGIESSYRQLNECRIRTSTREPVLRLLYVGIAILLRNIWVWCHLNWLAMRHGRAIALQLNVMRLREMTLWIEQLIIEEFGLVTQKTVSTKPKPATTTGPPI